MNADQWVSNSQSLQNPGYKDFGGTDCTNFVSQALFAGGYDMANIGADKTKYVNWYSRKNLIGFDVSFTWSVSFDLLTWLQKDIPGGSTLYYRSPSETVDGKRSGGATGDVLFYDWGVGEGVSHAAIQVGYGTDPVKFWVGDLIDMHSNDHKHAIWSLRPYNGNLAGTTYITVVHVDSGN
jgi:hypothetical protein